MGRPLRIATPVSSGVCSSSRSSGTALVIAVSSRGRNRSGHATCMSLTSLNGPSET
jgi:hypothetical protein